MVPIYFVICWITIYHYDDKSLREFVLIGGITTLPAIALPAGWWIYNSYRTIWIGLEKGYEKKDFIKLVNRDLKPFFSPLINAVLIDFSQIKGIGSWIKIDIDIFLKTFYPFTSKQRSLSEIEQLGIHPEFTEHVSDSILFKDSSYDYARSISSVRYGIESSIYAALLSLPYAFGLKAIWLFGLHVRDNEVVLWTWILVLIVLTSYIMMTIYLRRKYANMEYDARLNLTTLTSARSNYFDTKFFETKISQEIINQINLIPNLNSSYAAFDLDNTLLIDDIGEAVFASLIKGGLVKDFGWNDYLNLLKENREAAYKRVISVMDGLELSKLKQITHEIIDSNELYIEIGENRIAIPKPNPIMQSMISLLKTKHVDVYVVTASNKISAEIVCWKYFGTPSSNVFGIDVKSDSSGRICYQSPEIPFGEGKVNALKKTLKSRPIVTGGDGVWDRFLLDYTTSDGIRLWLGHDKNEYQKLKQEFYKDLNFFHIL